MLSMLAALAAFTSTLRTVLLAGGIVIAAVATVDWAARTRRINPFGAPSRFLRTNVDPRLVGIERQVVRAGGHPSAVPMWALVAYVVLAALLLAAVEMLSGLVLELLVATESGAMGYVVLAIRCAWPSLCECSGHGFRSSPTRAGCGGRTARPSGCCVRFDVSFRPSA
jgi:hypothetical protein